MQLELIMDWYGEWFYWNDNTDRLMRLIRGSHGLTYMESDTD